MRRRGQVILSEITGANASLFYIYYSCFHTTAFAPKRIGKGAEEGGKSRGRVACNIPVIFFGDILAARKLMMVSLCNLPFFLFSLMGVMSTMNLAGELCAFPPVCMFRKCGTRLEEKMVSCVVLQV